MRDKNFVILVSGGAGYIGSHAVLALLDRGWRVVVVDNLSTGFRWAVPSQAVFVEGDIGNAALMRDVIRAHEITAIFHFAGSVVVPESVANPLKYYRNNTAASASLISAAVENDVRTFIFSSTAAVYGLPETSLVTEDSPTRPINPYGRSKLMTELMLGDVAAAHRMNFGVLRYFNVAGADPLLRSGQATKGATHLIKVALEAATGRRDGVSIFGNDFSTPDGTGVRDYIHVSDLAVAHIDTLEYLIHRPGENLTLNCGYGRGYSVLDVLSAVDRVAGGEIRRRIEPRRPGDPDALIADNSRIRNVLAWRPNRHELNTIISDALAWEKHQAERLAGSGNSA